MLSKAMQEDIFIRLHVGGEPLQFLPMLIL